MLIERFTRPDSIAPGDFKPHTSLLSNSNEQRKANAICFSRLAEIRILRRHRNMVKFNNRALLIDSTTNDSPHSMFSLRSTKLPQVIASLLALIFIGCTQRNDENTGEEAASKAHDYLTASTLWVQTSAEYKALCYQAYALATDLITERCAERGDGDAPIAVVFDLDETVLDNSAYTGWQITNDQAFTPESWAKWTDLAAAPAVPGAVEFTRYADSLGVALFFISNRDVSALESTQRNMVQLGIPQTGADHFYLKTNTSDKTVRRDSVTALGYEIALFIGDALGDFDGKYDKASVAERARGVSTDRSLFGARYIILPNPVYGTWEAALYDYNRELSLPERRQLRENSLISAPIN